MKVHCNGYGEVECDEIGPVWGLTNIRLASGVQTTVSTSQINIPQRYADKDKEPDPAKAAPAKPLK